MVCTLLCLSFFNWNNDFEVVQMDLVLFIHLPINIYVGCLQFGNIMK